MAEQGRLKSWQTRDRPSRKYQLPSCGWLYDDLLPGGDVAMSSIRGEDEEIIGGAGEGAAALPVLRDILERLTDTGKLPYKRILFSDWLSLLFNFFAFSYGSEMSFGPKCPLCKQFPPQPYVRSLEELPCTIYDTDPLFDKKECKEPFVTQKLPPYDDVINFRLLRVEDQIKAEKFYRQGKAAGKRGNFVQSYAMAKHILGVNGEEVTLFEALDYVRNGTTGETMMALRREFSAREPGYFMTIDLVCPLCNGGFDVRLPEDGSFFRRVDTQYREAQAAKTLDAELRSGEPVVPGLGGDDAVAEG